MYFAIIRKLDIYLCIIYFLNDLKQTFSNNKLPIVFKCIHYEATDLEMKNVAEKLIHTSSN